MRGAALVLFGAFEKFVISGTLAQYYVSFLDPSLSGWNTVFGVVLYGLYLYSDFDAYSSIAIGTARLLGFRLDANFRAPYLSSSMNEFWRRWHISLGSWLRDYVYIPLGGSRKGFLRKQLNILIVFLVSGIWHGNTLMFVIWGLGCGIVCVIDNLIAWLFQKAPKAVLVIGKILGIVINDGLVLALWVFFFSSDLSSALDVFSRMRTVFDGAGFAVSFEAAGLSAAQGIVCLALIAVIVVTDVLRYFFGCWNRGRLRRCNLRPHFRYLVAGEHQVHQVRLCLFSGKRVGRHFRFHPLFILQEIISKPKLNGPVCIHPCL